jgi:hypothetical protein
MRRLDLNIYRSADSKVFSGRSRGAAVRQAEQLDSLDTTSEKVVVVIPDDTYSINTSFFLGLFGQSIRAAGSKEAFLARFSFQCPPDLMNDVLSAVDDALKESSSLGGWK